MHLLLARSAVAHTEQYVPKDTYYCSFTQTYIERYYTYLESHVHRVIFGCSSYLVISALVAHYCMNNVFRLWLQTKGF